MQTLTNKVSRIFAARVEEFPHERCLERKTTPGTLGHDEPA